MIDQDAEGLGSSGAGRDPSGIAAPAAAPRYGRVSDSIAREATRSAKNQGLEGPPENLGPSPIGEYLRRQRILRDMSIEELSALTRIPLRSLDRLERGEFDGETDGFVRGFVRTVAQALGLDADSTVARILQEPVQGAWERHASNRRLKQALVAGTLLALIGLSLLVLQAGWGVLVGSTENDPARQVVVWRDPVRTLAEATGAEVDPAAEIDPRNGSSRFGPASQVGKPPSGSSQRPGMSPETPAPPERLVSPQRGGEANAGARR